MTIFQLTKNLLKWKKIPLQKVKKYLIFSCPPFLGIFLKEFAFLECSSNKNPLFNK